MHTKLLFTHYSYDPQPLYSEKNIKNGSHGTIYTFKNYFATVFSVFSKINCIQTDPYNDHFEVGLIGKREYFVFLLLDSSYGG